VGGPDVALRVDLEVVGGLEGVPAPGAQELAVGVVDLHGRVGPGVDVDVVVGVLGDAGHLAPGDAGWPLRPVRIDGVGGGDVHLGILRVVGAGGRHRGGEQPQAEGGGP